MNSDRATPVGIGSSPLFWISAGAVCLLIALIGGAFDWPHFFRAYLVAWLLLLGLSLGSLALVMIQHLTGGVWGLALRRILEAQLRTLPLVIVLFIPIALGVRDLYPWANEDAGSMPSFRANYFAPTFVAVRWLAYFAVWMAPGLLLSRWSSAADREHAHQFAQLAQDLAGPGLVIYGLALHFATIDWVMAVEGDFTSTIYGPIMAAGQLLSAYCLSLIVLTALSSRREIREVLSPQLWTDLGSLLLALLVVWVYLLWFQFMLIWMADIRRDNLWYLERSSRAWLSVIGIIAVGGFLIPFFLLLFRVVKRTPRIVAGIAALLLIVQWLHLEYMVMPPFRSAALEHWLDLPLVLGLGGIWLGAFLWLLNRRPLVLQHDRNWPQAIHLQHLAAHEAEREEGLHHA